MPAIREQQACWNALKAMLDLIHPVVSNKSAEENNDFCKAHSKSP